MNIFMYAFLFSCSECYTAVHGFRSHVLKFYNKRIDGQCRSPLERVTATANTIQPFTCKTFQHLSTSRITKNAISLHKHTSVICCSLHCEHCPQLFACLFGQKLQPFNDDRFAYKLAAVWSRKKFECNHTANFIYTKLRSRAGVFARLLLFLFIFSIFFFCSSLFIITIIFSFNFYIPVHPW